MKIEFNILKEGQQVWVIDRVHNLYNKPIRGTIKTVVSPTHYMVESEEIDIVWCKSILTFHLMTESMEYYVV